MPNPELTSHGHSSEGRVDALCLYWRGSERPGAPHGQRCGRRAQVVAHALSQHRSALVHQPRHARSRLHAALQRPRRAAAKVVLQGTT